jgi:hypothetical protein
MCRTVRENLRNGICSITSSAKEFAMGARVIRCGAVVAALVSLTLTESAQLRAADVEVDFANSVEAVIAKDRVALLSVTRFTEFVAVDGGNGRRAVTSLRVMVLREWLGDRALTLTASEVDVFAAGTTDKPVRFAGNSHTTSHSSRNYGGYADWLKRQTDEWAAVKLPAVKDANLATVSWVTFHDVQITAKIADVRVKVGEGVVLFKNVPLE